MLRSPAKFWIALLGLGLISVSLRARDRVLVGLVDLRGRNTFRVIETDKLADPNTFGDYSQEGLIAGVNRVADPEDLDGDGDLTEITRDRERRAFFRPTMLAPSFQGPTPLEVLEVSMQVGGGMAEIQKVDAPWGAGTDPSELFAIATSSVSASDLTTIFQALIDAKGNSTATNGFRLTSTRNWNSQNPFHVRFAVRVREGGNWQITGQIRQLPAKRILEFRSSRPGTAVYTINGTVVLQGVPVAAGAVQRYDVPLGLLQPGNNVLRVEIFDPNDGTSQVLVINTNG